MRGGLLSQKSKSTSKVHVLFVKKSHMKLRRKKVDRKSTCHKEDEPYLSMKQTTWLVAQYSIKLQPFETGNGRIISFPHRRKDSIK